MKKQNVNKQFVEHSKQKNNKYEPQTLRKGCKIATRR